MNQQSNFVPYFIKPGDPNYDKATKTAEFVSLSEKWKCFINQTDNDRLKKDYFMDFCSLYSTLILAPLTRQNSLLLSQGIIDELVIHGAAFYNDNEVYLKCIEAIENGISVSDTIKLNTAGTRNLFFAFLKCGSLFKDTIPKSSYFFDNHFSQKEAASDLANSPFFEKCVPYYFCATPSIETSQYISKFLSSKINQAFFATLNFKKTLGLIISWVGDRALQKFMRPKLAYLFVTCYQRFSLSNKNCTHYIYENSCLTTLEELLTSETRPNIYSILINTSNDDKSPPPNSQNLKYVFASFQNRPEEQKMIFEMISNLMKSNISMFEKMNTIVPIKNWFESPNIDLKSAIVLLSITTSALPQDTVPLLQQIFKILDHKGAEIEMYLEIFKLIENIFTKRLISLKDLRSLHFLKIFVLKQTSQHLSEFFEKAPNFTQLALDILHSEQDIQMRSDIFKSILFLHSYIKNMEQFISICSATLIITPTKDNIETIIKEIEKTQQFQLVMIFICAFPKSVELTNNFIEMNLHKWISDQFDSEKIDLLTLANMFASLVVLKPYRELNTLIQAFDKSHPIFSLDKERIDKIVFGLKDISIYPHRPIRVSALFHLLDCPERCSPYNAWVIGKFCLSNFEDFEKVPFLPCVANRFMHSDDVERSLMYPKMFEKFCDMSYDHFSMFQFYAGTEEMTITHNFTVISFWFIFSEELEVDVQVFHTNNLFFTLNQGTLTIICDGQTIVVDSNPTQWNHVFIRLESSLMSQTIKITINNDMTYPFQPKTKLNEFTCASFSAANNSPMLFLGSAIRLSSTVPKDFSMIYKNGPGYIEPSDELNETLLVTPYAVSNIKIPLTCFPVPYMGFPVHNLSNHNFKVMMRNLREADDIETYSSVFRAICNINIITRNYNKKFWKQLLHSIKHAKLFPTTELLKMALDTVIAPKMSNKIFKSLLYGNSLWTLVDNEVLVNSLFDCFPNANWKSYQNSEVFLAKVVERNPSNNKIINKIFSNWRKVPTTIKLIISMLKSGSKKKEDFFMMNPRPSIELQMTILDCILNIIDKRTIEIFQPYFSFDELRYMFIVFDTQLAIKIYHIIVVFATFNVDFIQIDSAFLCKISSLCYFTSIWKDTIFLITGDTDSNSSSNIRRPNLIPILLFLIWSCGAYLIDNQKEVNKEIEMLLGKGINIISNLLPIILQRPDCQKIIHTYFPLILNYHFLNKNFKEVQFPMKIPTLNVSNLGEKDDPFWSNALSRIHFSKFPDPPPVKTSHKFLEFILSGFLKTDNQPEFEFNESFLLSSHLFTLLCDVVLHSGTYAILLSHNLFSNYFSNQNVLPIRTFIIGLLRRSSIEMINTALSVTFYFTGTRCLSNYSDTVFSELFTLSKLIFQASGKEGLMKYSKSIMNIFIELFTTVPTEDYKKLFVVIRNQEQLFTQMAVYSKMTKCWIYGFSIAFKDIDGNEDLLKSLLIDNIELKNDEILKFKSNWEEMTSQAVSEFEKIRLNINNDYSSTIAEASFEYTKKIYIANCKHFLVSCLLNDTFSFIDSPFYLFIEKQKWSNFLIFQEEMRSSKSNFHPKSFHLSPRCIPYYPPSVVSPSPFEYFKGDDYSKSPILQMFNTTFIENLPHIKRDKRKIFDFIHEKFNKWGTPQSIQNCHLYRYQTAIPSITLWYPQIIIVLTYAKIEQNEIQLIEQTSIDPKEWHVFIESVILGHYGKTTLFMSHVTILIPHYSILYVSRFTDTELAFWTFNSGHFILQYQNINLKSVTSYLDKINKVAVDSFPLENYLTQTKTMIEAFNLWKNKKVTTLQFLFTINALGKRSFVDLTRYPFIPSLLTKESKELEFPDASFVISILNRALPFHYYYIDNSVELQPISSIPNLPAVIVSAPILLTDLNHFGIGDATFSEGIKAYRHFALMIQNLLGSDSNRDRIVKWSRSHFTIASPRTISLGPSAWPTKEMPTNEELHNDKKGKTKNGPNLMLLLHRQKSTVISIARRLSRLTFVNNLNDAVLFCEYHHMYGFAESISVSIDGVFFVIDFAFGITRAYKVIYSQGNPTRAKCLCEFSAGAKPISSVSGHDWICATASGNILAFWEIISGTVHRLLKFDADITALSFDESSAFVWIAIENKAIIIGINGKTIATKELDDKITSLMNLHNASSAFCGTKSGKLFKLKFDLTRADIEINELESQHKEPIERIILQRSVKRYLTVDSIGMVEKWDPEGNRITDLGTPFANCVVCRNPTNTLCQLCNQPICSNCLPKHSKGPNCRHCIAFL